MDDALDVLNSNDGDLFAALTHFRTHPHPPALPRLIELAEDTSQASNIRFRAIEALGSTRDPSCVEALIALLNDDDDDVSSTAAHGLGQLGDPRAVEALGTYLRAEGDEFAHSGAAMALGWIGDEAAVPHLLAGLEDEREAVRQWSAESLGKVELSDERRGSVVEALARHIAEDESEDVQQYCAQALGAAGRSLALDPLAPLACGDDDDLAWAAAWGLARSRDPRAIEALATAYARRPYEIADPLARLITEVGDDTSIALALRLIAAGERRGFDALAGVGSRVGTGAALEAVLSAPATKETKIHRDVAAARLGDAKAANRLIKKLGGTHGAESAIGLALAGDPRGFDRCVLALDDEYDDVRRRAARALGELGRARVLSPDDEGRAVAALQGARLGPDDERHAAAVASLEAYL